MSIFDSNCFWFNCCRELPWCNIMQSDTKCRGRSKRLAWIRKRRSHCLLHFSKCWEKWKRNSGWKVISRNRDKSKWHFTQLRSSGSASLYNKSHLHTASHFLRFPHACCIIIIFFFLFLFPCLLRSKEQFAILDLLFSVNLPLVSAVRDGEVASVFWRTTSPLPFLSSTTPCLPSLISCC